MFYKKLITLFLALIFFQAISAEVMKKDEVLKLSTKLNGQCPSYSLQIQIGNEPEHCHYNFYCKNDTCYSSALSFDAAESVEDQNGKELKIEGKCKTNNDCLSNVCENKRCNNDSITQCVVPRNGNAVSCGKPSLSTCKADNECASGICNGTTGLCEIVFQKELMKIVKTSLYLVFGFIAVGIAVCIGICVCICCCIKKRNNKQDPMV